MEVFLDLIGSAADSGLFPWAVSSSSFCIELALAAREGTTAVNRIFRLGLKRTLNPHRLVSLELLLVQSSMVETVAWKHGLNPHLSRRKLTSEHKSIEAVDIWLAGFDKAIIWTEALNWLGINGLLEAFGKERLWFRKYIFAGRSSEGV